MDFGSSDIVELVAEERAILDLLIQAREARERAPIANRALVRRPEKYAFPIGVDERGDAFPLPAQQTSRGDGDEP